MWSTLTNHSGSNTPHASQNVVVSGGCGAASPVFLSRYGTALVAYRYTWRHSSLFLTDLYVLGAVEEFIKNLSKAWRWASFISPRGVLEPFGNACNDPPFCICPLRLKCPSVTGTTR